MKRIAQALLTQLSEVLFWSEQMDAHQVEKTVAINQSLSGSGLVSGCVYQMWLQTKAHAIG